MAYIICSCRCKARAQGKCESKLWRHVSMLLHMQALYFTWCDRLAGSFRDTHRLILGDEEKKAA